jgi:uncharacterized protein YkwD
MKHKRLLTILLTAFVFFCAMTVLYRPAKPTVAPRAPEKPLLIQINELRASVGKSPLAEDPKLDVAAQNKAADMIRQNTFEHQLPDGSSPFKYVYEQYPIHAAGAENLAKCQTSDSQRVNNWQNSPGHYQTMIGDFNRFGWAEQVNPRDNCIWTVTYFYQE